MCLRGLVCLFVFPFAVSEEVKVLLAVGWVACLIFFRAQAHRQTVVCKVSESQAFFFSQKTFSLPHCSIHHLLVVIVQRCSLPLLHVGAMKW